jgi:DNA-binding IclR family transcriptional regulator
MHNKQVSDDSSMRNRSASLRRALTLLSAIGDSDAARDGLGLAELAAEADVDKSTALRLLAPLREFNFVETDDAGHYRLGVGLLRLGQAYLDRLDLRSVALPVLRELTQLTGETSHLVLYQHPDVVYIDKVEADSAVQMRSRIGKIEPAASTGVGRAYLSHAPAAIVDEIVAAGLTERTPSTITSIRKWRAELDATRERGYAIDDCENEAEIRCVGAAILDHRGQPAAALSVAGPAWRLTRTRAQELGPVVAQAAQSVSTRLGAGRPAASAHRRGGDQPAESA